MAVTSLLLLKLLLVEKKEQRGLQKKADFSDQWGFWSQWNPNTTLYLDQRGEMFQIFENVPFFLQKFFRDGKDQRYVFILYCLEHSGAWVLVFSESETFSNLAAVLTEWL